MLPANRKELPTPDLDQQSEMILLSLFWPLFDV